MKSSWSFGFLPVSMKLISYHNEFNFSGSTSLNSTLSRSNFEINNEDLVAVDCLPERLNAEVSGNKSTNWQFCTKFVKVLSNGNDSINATQNYHENSSDCNSIEDEPPKPPPRPKRKSRMKIKNLSLDEKRSAQDLSHQNDILFRTNSTLQLRKEKNFLKGKIAPVVQLHNSSVEKQIKWS